MTAASSQTPATLLPSNFDPSRITFLPYDLRLGDKVRRFITTDCKRVAHQGSFEPSVAARQFFNGERQIQRAHLRQARHNLSAGQGLGGRLAMYTPPGQDPIIVAMYSLVLDDQGAMPGPSVTAFIDSLHVPATLENPSVLVDNLLLGDVQTRAIEWSVAIEAPVGLACYITHKGFGRHLESQHRFMLAARGVKTRAYGEANLYLRTYDAKE